MKIIRSVLLVPLVLLGLGSLDRDKHVVLIRGDQNLFIAGFNSEEGEVVGRVHVPNQALRLFGQQRNVLGVVVACIDG
jgi:enoyl-CoA hydratase/carnithine racemase